jgi:DNA-binding transcriptional ArsR family regulator
MADAARLDRTFDAFAHPIRRAMLERLAAGELTVGEAGAGLGVAKPTISRHLKVLEAAGAVERVVDGRTHRLRLAEAPLAEAEAWAARQRRLWRRKFDVLEDYLREEERR